MINFLCFNNVEKHNRRVKFVQVKCVIIEKKNFFYAIERIIPIVKYPIRQGKCYNFLKTLVKTPYLRINSGDCEARSPVVPVSILHQDDMSYS